MIMIQASSSEKLPRASFSLDISYHAPLGPALVFGLSGLLGECTLIRIYRHIL